MKKSKKPKVKAYVKFIDPLSIKEKMAVEDRINKWSVKIKEKE